MAVPEFKVRLTLDDQDLDKALSRATAANDAFLGKLNEQVSQTNKQMAGLNASANTAAKGGLRGLSDSAQLAARSTRLNRQELLTLQYTASDVAASLASGASPFTIMLQQGGQVLQGFGSLKNMLSKLGSFITPVNLAIGATVGVLAAGGMAMQESSQQSSAYAKSLQATAGFAGLTGVQVQKLAETVSDASTVTQGGARDIIQSLTATGRVGPDLIGPMALAVASWSEITGKSSQAVVDDMADMRDGVAKWATEHSKQYHFLSVSQLQYIQSLEEQGKSEAAAMVVLQQISQQAGTSAGAWDTLAQSVSNAWAAIKSGLAGDDTLEKQLQSAKDALASMQRMRGFNSMVFGRNEKSGVEVNQEQLIAHLNEEILRRDAGARDRSNRAAADDKANAAQLRIKQLGDEVRGQTALNKALEDYQRDLDLIAQAGGRLPSAQDQEAQRAKLRDKYNPKAAQSINALAQAIQAQQQSMGQEKARLDKQIDDYGLFGRSLDDTTRSVLEFDLAHGKLKGTSADVAEQMRAEADAIDADRKKIAGLEEGARLDKRILALKAATDAQAMNNREQRVAQELAQIDATKLPAGTEAYAERAQAIRDAVNADEDRLTLRRLADQSASTDSEVARMQAETAALGQNSLQRQISTYQLKLEAEARKEIANSPQMTDQINASKAQELAKYSQAATDAYAAQNDAVSGLTDAVARYQEQANQTGRIAGEIFTRTADSLTDSISRAVTTGKASFRDLWQGFLEEFVRAKVRMAIANMAADFNLGSFALSLFGATAGGKGGGAIGTSGGGATSTPTFEPVMQAAAGGNPPINQATMVGERGMELFVPRVPGTIYPNASLKGAGGPSMVVNNYNTVGSQVGRSDLEAAMIATQRLTEDSMMTRLRRMGVI